MTKLKEIIEETSLTTETELTAHLRQQELIGEIESSGIKINVNLVEAGPRGLPGSSLQFDWQGTKLGIKTDREASFQYTELGLDYQETYIHSQIEASKEWLIEHPLGKYPSVTIVDSANNIVVGHTTYLTEHSLLITFSAEFAGKAYLN